MTFRMPRCYIPSMKAAHRLHPAALAVPVLLLCFPVVAHADAGLPMLPVGWPKLLLYLAAVIAIETAYLQEKLRSNWRRTAVAVTGANLVTTGLGYPLAWLIFQLFNADLHMQSGPTDILSRPAAMSEWISAQLFPAWYGSQQIWPELGVFLVLLVPGYLLSGLVKVWVLDSYDLLGTHGHARTSVWHANRLSYLFVAVAGCLFLYTSQQ